jgi:general secretion pathway protein N
MAAQRLLVLSMMARLLFGMALMLTWSLKVHAELQWSNQPSAVPSLQLESLSQTRERPLFVPTRRKSPPPAPAAPKPVTQKQPQFTLRGIIVFGQESVVLLRDDSTDELFTLHPGDTVGNWHVFIESNSSIKLKDGAKEIRLEMFALK